MTALPDDERKTLYTSLLRGIANEAQDRLCAADTQHAWGQWVRYQVQPDYLPLRPVTGEPMACQEQFQITARRVCLNCGKEGFSG